MMIKSIDHAGCIKCGICEKFCPGNVIVISKKMDCRILPMGMIVGTALTVN